MASVSSKLLSDTGPPPISLKLAQIPCHGFQTRIAPCTGPSSVADDEFRGRQAAVLEVLDERAPVGRGFTRRRAQRQQLFLAVWCDSERRKDGNAHDALGHPNLQVEAV